jgi:hypothetical protein
MVDELTTDFLVCKQNLELLEKHGPYFQLKFLKGLVSKAGKKGDSVCATRITGIIQKEATQKWWQRINKSTGKACGSLTLAVKVPIADGGFSELKTKEGIFQAVSETLVERFQSALIAQCHQDTFFEDMGHLADGPVAQQILKGIPKIWTRQHNSSLRRQLRRMLLSHPPRLQPMSPWRTSSTSGK